MDHDLFIVNGHEITVTSFEKISENTGRWTVSDGKNSRDILMDLYYIKEADVRSYLGRMVEFFWKDGGTPK